MNPEEQYMNDFKVLFAGSSIDLTHEDDEVVFYHDVDLTNLSSMEQAVFDHINSKLHDAGITHWLNYRRKNKWS